MGWPPSTSEIIAIVIFLAFFVIDFVLGLIPGVNVRWEAFMRTKFWPTAWALGLGSGTFMVDGDVTTSLVMAAVGAVASKHNPVAGEEQPHFVKA